MKKEELNKILKSEEYILSDIINQILMESYCIIGENIDLNNTYSYEDSGRGGWFTFLDKNNFEHQIKMNYNPGLKDKEITVKFYWINPETDKPSFEKPPVTDEKVFNTHLKIFINNILPQFEKIKNGLKIDKLALDATDSIRYRLYRISLNQILDGSKYEIIEDPNQNILFIKSKI